MARRSRMSKKRLERAVWRYIHVTFVRRDCARAAPQRRVAHGARVRGAQKGSSLGRGTLRRRHLGGPFA